MSVVRAPLYMALGLVVLASLVLFLPNSAAQKPAIQSYLNPASEAYHTETDPVTRFNLIHVAGGIIDADLNIWRSGFGLSPNMSVRDTPANTARAWVDQYGQAYGISSSSHLKFIRETGAHGVRHVTFQQVIGPVPVYESFVHVNLGPHGLPTMVHSSYAPHIERAEALDLVPTVSEVQARSLAGAAAATGPFDVHAAELLIYPESTPRLIWSINVSPVKGAGSWRVLVDAHTGATVRILDQLSHQHSDDHSSFSRSVVSSSTTGRGFVWDPDPLTMAGLAYGGWFVDDDDQSNDQLASQLIEVDLPEISQGSDSLFRLEGPYAKIVETIDLYEPPALSAPDSFLFTRDADHFESVMAYYHIHSSQVYIQSLDIGRPVIADTVFVRSHGITGDNSFYDSVQQELTFGSGGVDDGEDVEVILHEYGHAVLHGGTPMDIGDGDEGSAYHEGFADYWALSYTRDLIERGIVPDRDWRQIFDWDAGIKQSGAWTYWPGRYIDPSLTYRDAGCRASAVGFCNIYADGTILAKVLMQLWEAIGKQQADRLILFSHAYLGIPFTMESSIQALVQADIDLNQGVNVALINRVFRSSDYPTHIAQVPEQPNSLSLQPNYPNPFTATTTISYSLEKPMQVRVEVFNLLGQRVLEFRDAVEPAGWHTHTLDLSNQPAGMYVLRITAENEQRSQPLLVVR